MLDVVWIVIAIAGLLVIAVGMRSMWRGDLPRNEPRPRVSGRYGYHPGGRTPMAKGDIGDGSSIDENHRD
jgi:hypothetical protein